MKFVKFIVDGKLYDIQPLSETSGEEENPLEMKKMQMESPTNSAENAVRKVLDAPDGKITKVRALLKTIRVFARVVLPHSNSFIFRKFVLKYSKDVVIRVL